MSKLITVAVTIAVFANSYASAQERTGLTEKQIRKIVQDEIRKVTQKRAAKKKQGGATHTPLRSAKTDVLILRAGEKELHYYLTLPQAGAEKKPAKKPAKRLPPPAKIHN
jgi:hypothetical protein